MTLDDLSVNFDHVDQGLLLSDWHWLIGKDKGQVPPKGQVFSFEVHPALGGEPVQANLKTADMTVHFSLLGQIFEQITDLPPGTSITGVQLVDG